MARVDSATWPTSLQGGVEARRADTYQSFVSPTAAQGQELPVLTTTGARQNYLWKLTEGSIAPHGAKVPEADIPDSMILLERIDDRIHISGSRA